MEKFNPIDIKKEINEIKRNLKIVEFNKDTSQRLDISFDKIERLLDPRPPISRNNFCPNCGHKIDSESDNLDSSNNQFEI